MENKKVWLVVKDEDGELRPMAGVWPDDVPGNMRAEMYKEKNKGDDFKIVKVEVSEIK